MGLKLPHPPAGGRAQAVIESVIVKASSPALFFHPYTDTQGLLFQLVNPLCLAPTIPNREVGAHYGGYGG